MVRVCVCGDCDVDVGWWGEDGAVIWLVELFDDWLDGIGRFDIVVGNW